MKHMLIFAGASALAFTAPAVAKPGNGHGNPHNYGNAYAYGTQGPVGYGVGGCPPGLAKKAVPCVPPGQARKQFGVGDQVPSGYNLLSYGALPRTIRSRHSLSPNSRYVYNGGTVYQVSPRKRTVTRVVRTR